MNENLFTVLPKKYENLIRHFLNKRGLKGTKWEFVPEKTYEDVDDFTGEAYSDISNAEVVIYDIDYRTPGLNWLQMKLHKVNPTLILVIEQQ